MITFIACALILLCAALLSLWLKREGEREWARHQQVVQMRQLGESLQKFGEAMKDVGVAARRAGLAMQKMMERAAR